MQIQSKLLTATYEMQKADIIQSSYQGMRSGAVAKQTDPLARLMM